MDKSKKIVLVGGCFDILHYGHIAFLKQAKKQGDWLVIALEADESVRRMKGETRPIHTQEQRKEMLESLRCVDEVIALAPTRGDRDYYELVRRVRPSIIATTQGDPHNFKKKEQADEVGAILVEIPRIHSPSTSQLVKLIGLE